jgi:hypothetical protein
MENPEIIDRQEIDNRLNAFIDACKRYTEINGRYLYVDIYPLDPHFLGSDEYAYEIAEVRRRSDD